MRILIEPSDYVLRNVGDIAMMKVAVRRVRQQFPNAEIDVLTDEPARLPQFIPRATPHDSSGRSAFLGAPLLPWLPRQQIVESEIRLRWPKFAGDLVSRMPRPTIIRANARAFMQELGDIDSLVVAGMGGITDYFPDYARNVLETILQAGSRGAYVAMMGQGIGPLQSPSLRRLARMAFRHVRFFALREGVFGPCILKSLGVPDHEIVCTGDDAIEEAHDCRSADLGGEIGLNMRISDYSALTHADAAWVYETIKVFARRLETDVLPVPISFVPGEADQQTYSLVRRASDFPAFSDVPHVSGIVERISHCRMVVTGSYHAGVFALACGIPCICISASAYYHSKFAGLAAQFGVGCMHVDFTKVDWRHRFEEALQLYWNSAEEMRPALLEAAKAQVQSSVHAYARLATEMRSHC